MFSRLFVMILAVVTVVTPAFGDGVTVVAKPEVVEQIVAAFASGRPMSQAGVEGLLGNKEAAVAFVGALGKLKEGNKGFGTADHKAIQAVIKPEDAKDASKLVQRYIAASTSKELAAGKSLGNVFATVDVSTTRVYETETVSGIEMLTKATPSTLQGQAGQKKLLLQTGRSGRIRQLAAIAAMTIAALVTPQTCQAAEAKECGALGQEIVLMHAAEDFDLTEPGEAFLADDILKGFPEEKDGFAAKKANKGVLLGAKAALAEGREGMPKPVQHCFLHRKPPVM